MEHKQSNDITHEAVLEVYERLINVVKEYEAFIEQKQAEEPHLAKKLHGCISLVKSLENIRNSMIEQHQGKE